jgi:hypothetical protein
MDSTRDGTAADGARSDAITSGDAYGAVPVRLHAWLEWLLVDGSRLRIAAGITLGVFVFLVAVDAVGVIAFRDGAPVSRLASGLAAGVFSLTTLVVSINQLILSREFATPEESRHRLESILDFHRDVESTADVPAAPAEPTELLELLAAQIDRRARTVRERVEGHPDEGLRRAVLAYADEVVESSERLDRTLEESEFGTFRALSATMSYDDGWQIYAARYLRERCGEELGRETADAFDELLDVLEFFSTAREHFKTIYMQRELTQFSRLIVVSGVAGTVASALLALVYATAGDPAVPTAYLPFAASFLASVAVFPIALLAAYILRTATVTRRTAALGPILIDAAPEERPFRRALRDL